MKIASIRAAAVSDPRLWSDPDAPLREWNKGTNSTNPLSRYRELLGQGHRFQTPWSMVVCVVEATDGTFGVGVSSHAGPVVPIINDYFAPMLEGESVFATEFLWNMMVRGSAAKMGAAGVASYAISAVDLALWDLKGKLLGRPVYELVGGPARSSIHCYATGHDIDWYRELGFEAIKLCALEGAASPTASLEGTVEMVAGFRDQLGADFDLMIDLWPVHDPLFTIELGSRLAPYNLRWLEDYLHPEDFVGYQRVRQRLPTQSLAAGERWYTDRPFANAARDHWVDVFQPDVQWVGGATAVLKIAAIADAAGIELALHAGCNDPYGQHLCAALPGNRWGEFYVHSAPGVPLDNGYRNVPGMAVPRDGKLVVSDAPGFGIELTLEMIESAT
ncbi:MAG: hypothetical protein CMO26_22270 [Thiotrichales bacterium]|nr:hypothetical protein [Thiotrichales bacterium]MBS38638.1 hypothetical protein [Thiotrichales bacterium]